MTVFCLISLILGAYIVWVNTAQDSADSAATTFPLGVVAVVHLLGGSIAIINAIKTKNIIKNLPIYAYFLFVLTLALRILIKEVASI